MANDYESEIGIWMHKIGNIEHKIIPREGDNIRIAGIMKEMKHRGYDWGYTQFNKLYFDMVVRDEPISEEIIPKLKLWIEKNQIQIQKDVMVTFGWQTKEQQDRLENMDGENIKKLIDA